jgi:5-methylcytosine-specific restriction endonuclease McrA
MTERPNRQQRPKALPVPRRRLSRVEFAQLMLDQEGRCAACRQKLRADLIVDEHLVPLDHLGSNDLSNRALFCTGCARAKTEDDQANIRHGRRVRGEAGQKRTRALRKLKPWTQPRTFPTNRDGPLKRKMNGQVVRRPLRKRKLRPVRTFQRRALTPVVALRPDAGEGA